MTGRPWDLPVPPQRPPDQVADAHAQASRARAGSPGALGLALCDDPADVYDSAFRRWARLGPVHLCRLRELARRQVCESRSAEADR